MQSTVHIHEDKAQLSADIARAEAGEEVVIARAKAPGSTGVPVPNMSPRNNKKSWLQGTRFG